MNVPFRIPTRSLRKFCCLFLAAACVAVAANEVEQLGEAFEKRRAAVTTQRDEQLAKLETGYLAALNRQLDKVKASGKLEEVLSIRDEIEDVKDGEAPLQALPATASQELKQLRKTYDESMAGILKTHASSVAELAAKLAEVLKAKEVQLTKAGKIDLAVEAKTLREAVEQEEGIAVEKPGKGGGAEGWISIKKAEMKVISESQYPVKWIDAQYRPAIPQVVAKHVDAAGADENSLMMHGPASVKVTYKSYITRFRCKTLLAEAGDAKLTVFADGKIVEQFDLKGAGKTRDIDIRFPQSRELILTVEINGIQHGDWAVWMNPEAR